jgi:O-succinylbenzoic acid--CoA ligase
VRNVVAVDLPGGPAFVAALQRVWDAGDAALPLDRRLPPPARAAVLQALAPTHLLGEDGEWRRLPGGRPCEDGDALVLATSGTTGQPKGVVLTHQAVAASAAATHARLGADPARHAWVACLPLAHVGGLAVVTRALLGGFPLEVHDGFQAEAVTQAAARLRAAGRSPLVSLVATALRRVDPAVFDRILLGAAAPPADVPPNVVVTYGMTETGSGVVYDGIPLEGVEVAIGDGQRGQVGEVLLRGPMLLRTYRHGPAPFLPGGWLPTGDGGRITPEGRLEVQGRLAEVIVTGGEKVWPAAVERVLQQQAGVAEVAVVGRPDPEWGQAVVALVVPSPTAPPPRREALAEAVKATVSPWAAPKEVVLVDALPRTPSGKVARSRLAALLEQAGAGR